MIVKILTTASSNSDKDNSDFDADSWKMNKILDSGVFLVSTNDYEGRIENIRVVLRAMKNERELHSLLTRNKLIAREVTANRRRAAYGNALLSSKSLIYL